MEEKSIKDIVLEEYEKGNIVYATQEGLMSAKLDTLLSQPIEGLLYDLNRDFGTILTFIDDPKWVNDYALSKVVVELKQQLGEADKSLSSLNYEYHKVKNQLDEANQKIEEMECDNQEK